jgi:hypothetical protein
LKKTFGVFWAFFFILSPLLIFSQWKELPVKKKLFTDESRTVYVIPGEQIYHNFGCPLLGNTYNGMSQGLAEKKGAKPCPSCFLVTVSSGYEWNFDLRAPVNSKNLVYSDGAITIAFVISKSQVLFEIQNMTDSGIKINWDDISFISPTNRASRVVHSGIRFIDKSNPQAPTVIPPKSKISDILIPSENVSFSTGWNEGSLFEGDTSSYIVGNPEPPKPLIFNGREFGIYFPIEIKGVKKEYSFRFGISVASLGPDRK